MRLTLKKSLKMLEFQLSNGISSVPLRPLKLYINDHKVELLTKNPQLTDEDARKILEQRFLTLDEESQAIYIDKSIKLRGEYYLKSQQLMYAYSISL